MQAVSEAEALLRMLPDFMYDESGAVKEWSMKGMARIMLTGI